MTDFSAEDGYNPARGREPRAEGMKRERRRRRAGTLNRMAQMKLDIFAAGDLDLENYVYRWCNDEDNRLAMLTRADDYDFCNAADIKGFDAARSAIDTNSESDDRIRMVVGSNKGGQPIYSYLLKKPRDYWVEDQEEMVQARADMMQGRVYRGEVTEEDEVKKDTKTFYVPDPASVSLGGVPRRKGPIQRTKG